MPPDPPRYLHLLSAQEVRDLRPLLLILEECCSTIADSWYARHLEHFGDTITLSRPVFIDLFARDIEALASNLLAEDLDGFEADMRALGRDLLEHGVPFPEIIASLHLFEESASEHYLPRLKALGGVSSLYGTFDKLSHCRIILLAETYFAGHAGRVALRLRDLELEAARLEHGGGARTRFFGLIGASAVMRRTYEQIAAAAAGQGGAFIFGESGTGKELVARAIHEASARADGPFVAVNCAALPRELIESELFGHRRGAFTGAHTDYQGLIRSAAGGSLLLDEITEMAPDTQAKLLRVLEEHSVRPIGGSQAVSVAVRFIASTNRDPEQAVQQGLLRSDLFYRLNVHRIAVPPLRERRDDVPLLVAHLAQLLTRQGLRAVDSVEERAMAALQEYAWPGNVRELRSAMEYALTVGTSPQLVVSDLPPHVLNATLPQRPTLIELDPESPLVSDAPTPAVPTLQDAERELMVRALAATAGNKLQAARMLGISRHRLYDKLRKFGLHH